MGLSPAAAGRLHQSRRSVFPFSARAIVCGLYSVQAVESPMIDGLLANGFACLDKYGSSTQFWFGLSSVAVSRREREHVWNV